MPFGLSDADHARVCRVFEEHSAIEKVLIYGSRALARNREGSDIDLALFGSEITFRDLSAIENDPDDLLLPYTFDIAVFKATENADLRCHIERVGKEF
jgi:predicted nucleotidyltransferase